MTELWLEGKGRGRLKVDKRQRWQLSRLPVCASLVFCLDLQVLDCTLAEAVLENKDRCHKTPLRQGFAYVMTPLEMLRVRCLQQKPVRYAPVGVFITSSAAKSSPSDHLTMMENIFFVFSTRYHVVNLLIYFSFRLLVHWWENETCMLICEARLYINAPG